MTRARLLIAAALLALAAGSTSLSSGAFTATSANPKSTFTADANFPSTCTPGTASVTADYDKAIRSAGSPAPGPNDTTLTVGTTTASGPDAIFRALVHFPTPAIPTGCSFTGATMAMTTSSASTGRTINVHRASAAWTEATTWSGPAFDATALSGVAAASGQLSWNVTSAVAAVYGGGANNGFVVKDSTDPTISEKGNRTQVYVSSEGAAGSRPTLVVSYK